MTFPTIYNAYYPRLLFFAKRYVQEQDAKDIVMEVFEKLWEQIANFTSEQKCKAYLYIAVKNRCLKLIKKQPFYDIDEMDIADESVDAQIVKAELMHKIYQEIEALPANRRKMMELYLKGESTTEISHILDITKNNLYVLTKRTFEHLANKICSKL